MGRIWPSHTHANIYIDKLLMQQSNVIADPDLLNALKRYVSDDPGLNLPDFDEDIIDIEAET